MEIELAVVILLAPRRTHVMVGKLMADKNEQNVSRIGQTTKTQKRAQKRTLLIFARLLAWVPVFDLQDE